MAKVTTLPFAGPLTGAEPILVIQDGEARQGLVGALIEELAQPFVDQAEANATVALLTKEGLDASFETAKVSAASRIGGLYFTPANGAFDWGIGMVGGVDVDDGTVFDTVAFWFQVPADTATVRYRLYRRPLTAAWMAQGPGDPSDTQLGSTQNIAVADLGILPDGPRAYIEFGVGAVIAIEDGNLYIHRLEALDVDGNRLMSGIEYKNVTDLTTDQYRKWRRAGGPNNAWSEQVGSVTYVYCYDLRCDGYAAKTAATCYAPTVETATARINGSNVSIAAKLSDAGSLYRLASSVVLDAATGTDVVDETLTLTAAGGAAKTYGYLTNRTLHADLANVVVKDAVTLDVLVKDTHYWVIEELGCFSLPGTVGAPRNVLVSYSYRKMRYDVVHYTPSTGAIGVTKGTERDRDQAEFIPATPVGTIPLFNIHVRRSGNIAVPVFDVVDGVRRSRRAEFEEEAARNRRLLRSVIKRQRAGLDSIHVSLGDSNFAQVGGAYSNAALQASANTVFHDRSKDVGGLLRSPAYGTDVLDSIGAAGVLTTQYGPMWELKRAIEAAFPGTVTYKNRSIPGSNSTTGTYHGRDPVRLNAAVAENAHVAHIGFGQNELGQDYTRDNIIAICQAFQAVGTIPVIWGCFRPHAKDLHASHTTERWLKTQRLLREAAYAVGAPHISMLTLYADGEYGALGLSPYDHCAGTKDVHPGNREWKVIGLRAAPSFGV